MWMFFQPKIRVLEFVQSLNILLDWLVVWNIFYFSIYWECHHPNWRTPSFFRGVGIPPTTRWFSPNFHGLSPNFHGFSPKFHGFSPKFHGLKAKMLPKHGTRSHCFDYVFEKGWRHRWRLQFAMVFRWPIEIDGLPLNLKMVDLSMANCEWKITRW